MPMCTNIFIKEALTAEMGYSIADFLTKSHPYTLLDLTGLRRLCYIKMLDYYVVQPVCVRCRCFLWHTTAKAVMLALLNRKNEQTATAVCFTGANPPLTALFCTAVCSSKGGLLRRSERKFLTDRLVTQGFP